MKKIAVIYMGGTFGCIGTPLSPMPASEFLNQLAQYAPQKHVKYFAAPDIKDSSELCASEWLALAQYINTLSHEFQHFIIIHGTDTLSYAAAFLHHLFQQHHTIILTGSQYPLLTTDGTSLLSDSDAWDNFSFALDQIHKLSHGVYLSFAHHIHSAYQSYKTHTEHINGFSSNPIPTHDHIAQKVIGNSFQISTDLIARSKQINIVNYYLYPTQASLLAHQLKLLTQAPPQIIILQGFGSGNIPYNADLKYYLEQLIENGCWVIISSQVLYGQLSQKYATGSWLNTIKLVFDPHYSQADLYARATLLYLQYAEQKNWQHYWVN